jgi:hypothetical protein
LHPLILNYLLTGAMFVVRDQSSRLQLDFRLGCFLIALRACGLAGEQQS